MGYKAVYREGSDLLGNILIDIDASYSIQDEWLAEQRDRKKSVKQCLITNYANLALLVLLKKLNLWEAVVTTGIERKWLDEFRDYWSNVLGGVRINVSDFHQLRFHYRRQAHANSYARQLSWASEAEHLHNWQTPDNIYLTFNYVIKCALNPFRSRHLPRILKKGMRILEYGCALAPMYRTYRGYLNHVPPHWVLADIPNFPFHYARHVYARDETARRILQVCIQAIQRYTPEPHELWVVDNNSPKENIDWLLAWPDINVALNHTRPIPPEGRNLLTRLIMRLKRTSWGSYENAIGLEIAVRLVAPDTRYLMALHMDTMPCHAEWLSFLLSKLGNGIAASGTCDVPPKKWTRR